MITVLATITPPGSLAGFTGTNNIAPSRRASTLFATIARIIHTALFTEEHSIPRQLPVPTAGGRARE